MVLAGGLLVQALDLGAGDLATDRYLHCELPLAREKEG